MNKKIKIIEILNKINNREDLPTKIQYGYDNDNCPAIWQFNTSLKDYCCNERESGDNYLFRDYIGDITAVLDNEVEILEDNTEEIEEIKGWGLATDYKDFETINHTLDRFGNKINKLVKAVNKLKEGKE